MSLVDAKKLINESKNILEGYRMYGHIVADSIIQLETLEKLIEDQKNQEAYKFICGLCNQIGAYRSIVPDLAIKLDKISEILRKITVEDR
jgi:hypothetical protein